MLITVSVPYESSRNKSGRNTETQQNLENFRTGSEENSDVNVHSVPLFEFFYVILVVLTTKFILKN